MAKFLKSYALAALMAVAIVSFFAPRAAAQEGKIEGQIIDFEGKPWADLPVQVKSDQGAIVESKTDAGGKFVFLNLRAGKYTFSTKPPQMQTPFEIPTEVHSGNNPPPIVVNFKEILEKQNPEAAEKYKKQQETQQKYTGMKEHFAKGVALLDQERAAKPCTAEVGFVEPRIPKSGPTQVRLLQVDAREHSAIELGAAHVSLFQAGAPQQRPSHQRKLHIRLGETCVLEARRNEVCPTQTSAG